METITILSAKEFEAIIKRYEDVTHRLIEAERELELLRSDQYVDWKWVCTYLDVDYKTARLMLADEWILVHNRKIKKFLRSDIIRYAQHNRVKVKDIPV